MPRFDLIAELHRRTIVCDGGMGTQLMTRGMQPGECPELWNIQRPADVKSIHQAYADAGCDLLTTNTFGATQTSLDKHTLGERVGELNRAGAKLARDVAGDQRLVLGDVGPFGDFLEPLGDTTPAQLESVFRQQLEALSAGGADAIIIETMSDPNELAVAVRAAKSIAPWPVIATYAYSRGEGESFRTMMGTSAEDATLAAIDAGADVVGTNCGTSLSLEDYLRLAEVLVKAAGKTPVIVQPNAGSPQMVDGHVIYSATPQAMAQIARQLAASGVKIVGGCCGTTPDHLHAMAQALR